MTIPPAQATVLVICPTNRDHRHLPGLADANRYRFIFHEYATTELEEIVAPTPRRIKVRPVHEEIEKIVATAASAHVDAVISTDDYPGSTIAAIVARRLGLPGTPVVADLLCQHKYLSRLIQQRVVPETVPAFELINDHLVPKLPFPFFIKPVKSFFSVGAHRIDDLEALRTFIPAATLPEAFFEPLGALLERYVGMSCGHSTVLAEAFLSGHQATYEGYAFDGLVHPIGVVDSIFFPRTMAFKRFEYPSALSGEVQDRMTEIAARIMKAKGFRHGMFNIEFRYNAEHDTLSIIEINPRMASQFADLYEKVDGFNTYSLLLDLALGHRPVFHPANGKHASAASCVLRRFKDAFVMQTPPEEELRRVQHEHPDACIDVLARVGEYLSQQMQDSGSFRYGLIHLGGADRKDVLDKFAWCQQHLTFSFNEAPSRAAGMPAAKAQCSLL